MLRKTTMAIAVLLAAAGLYLSLWPIPIKPEAWTPPPNPGMTGPYAANSAIKDAATRFADKIGHGPEDVAIKDGFAYTGLEDGRIMKIALNGSSTVEFAKTGGRPLGLGFDASGALIVADAIKGLIAIAPDGTIRTLSEQIGGKRMVFVDDLDIGGDGTIWFSDASQRFGIKMFLNDMWEGSATGRLLSYDPATGETQVRLEGLRFANGVALSADGSFVLVNETAARRIRKLWLSGPKAGQDEMLIDGLPCFPDNLSRSPQGHFWIACPSPANDQFDDLMPQPFLRAVMFRLTQLGLVPPPVPPLRGWAIAIDGEGRVLASLMDPKGERYHTITSVNEFDGELYFGSIAENAIGRMPAPALQSQ